MSGGFILKRWSVSVRDSGEYVYLASTRGKAIAEAWRSFASVYDCTFRQFLELKPRAHRKHCSGSGFGDPILVGGQPAFYCGADSQYVHYARPGGEFTLLAHPYDVEPESYRPRSYRREVKS